MEFIKLTQESWNKEMNKYGGSCPNESNSSYEDRLVNFYRAYGDEVELASIKSDVDYMMESVVSSPYYLDIKIVENVKQDIDEIGKIGFVDVTLKPETTEEDFKSFLKWINSKF